ncbi:pirin family protein [Sneathiella sp. CAU 1612]|uniref:Pirin family protein n=1 Tax=Sneathiella sedimenti TaxID=2816034 RepID=A0ABS3F2F1_9PROT|nr:pirin family protein [Sneathiella sedimenti]MBO0332127.1 pirin family protein [Sneathiella sedimenti]
MTADSIALSINGKPKDIGGLEVRRLLPVAKCRSVGAFVFFDHMGPVTFRTGDGMDVLPHPHIGLATVTYLFEGSIMHRDSLGSVQEIFPGDVNLMTAGRGIVHSERSSEESRSSDQSIHGLQLWVALPKEHEEMAPAFSHTPKSALPELSGEGWHGRLIAGSLFGETSPVATMNRYFFADLRFDAGVSITFTPDYDEAAIYVVEGELDIDGASVEAGALAVLKKYPSVTLTSMKETIFVVLGGEALPEPRYMHWNFVSTSQERIERAKDDWRAQRFDGVPGDDSFVPLPE